MSIVSLDLITLRNQKLNDSNIFDLHLIFIPIMLLFFAIVHALNIYKSSKMDLSKKAIIPIESPPPPTIEKKSSEIDQSKNPIVPIESPPPPTIEKKSSEIDQSKNPIVPIESPPPPTIEKKPIGARYKIIEDKRKALIAECSVEIGQKNESLKAIIRRTEGTLSFDDMMKGLGIIKDLDRLDHELRELGVTPPPNHLISAFMKLQHTKEEKIDMEFALTMQKQVERFCENPQRISHKVERIQFLAQLEALNRDLKEKYKNSDFEKYVEKFKKYSN